MKDNIKYDNSALPNGSLAWYITTGSVIDGKIVTTQDTDKGLKDDMRVQGWLHRIDGPALIRSDGTYRFYYKAHPIDQEEIEEWINDNNINVYQSFDEETNLLFKMRFL